MTNNTNTDNIVHTSASPSLALIKYWGKDPSSTPTNPNLPATTSIAVTLDTLISNVTIQTPSKTSGGTAAFYLNSELQDFSFVQILLDAIQKHHALNTELVMHIDAQNNFPTSAGLASSASGYASLAFALSEFYGLALNSQELSSLARLGSGSASRSVYGGFTIWRKGCPYAEQLFSHTHWEDFRIIVCIPYTQKKTVSSRDGMNTTARTSPYYEQWCKYNNTLSNDAIHAIEHRDIEKLGNLTRLSYSAMHASAIASNPPIRYWKSQSILLLDMADDLRGKGIPIWETMDAGPQVKFITLAAHADQIKARIEEEFTDILIHLCKVGIGPQIHKSPTNATTNNDKNS